MRTDGLASARWISLLVPLGLIGGALFSQFVGRLVPCEMCMWQRWPHYAAIAIALLAFLARDRVLQILLVSLACMAIAASGAIGAFHAGVEYHWWPGITPCTASIKHGASAMEMLDQVLKSPAIRCDTPQWTLFHISLAGFNALFSLAGALAIFVCAAQGKRG